MNLKINNKSFQFLNLNTPLNFIPFANEEDIENILNINLKDELNTFTSILKVNSDWGQMDASQITNPIHLIKMIENGVFSGYFNMLFCFCSPNLFQSLFKKDSAVSIIKKNYITLYSNRCESLPDKYLIGTKLLNFQSNLMQLKSIIYSIKQQKIIAQNELTFIPFDYKLQTVSQFPKELESVLNAFEKDPKKTRLMFNSFLSSKIKL